MWEEKSNIWVSVLYYFSLIYQVTRKTHVFFVNTGESQFITKLSEIPRRTTFSFFSFCLCFYFYPTPTQHTHTHLKCTPVFSSCVFWLYLGSRRRVKIIFSTWTYYSLFILLNFTILLSNSVVITLISEFCIYLLWFSVCTDIGNHSFGIVLQKYLEIWQTF